MEVIADDLIWTRNNQLNDEGMSQCSAAQCRKKSYPERHQISSQAGFSAKNRLDSPNICSSNSFL